MCTPTLTPSKKPKPLPAKGWAHLLPQAKDDGAAALTHPAVVGQVLCQVLHLVPVGLLCVCKGGGGARGKGDASGWGGSLACRQRGQLPGLEWEAQDTSKLLLPAPLSTAAAAAAAVEQTTHPRTPFAAAPTCMPHTAGRWFATMPATVAFLLSQRLSPSLSSMADVRTLKDMTLHKAVSGRSRPGDTTCPCAGEPYSGSNKGGS